MWKVLTFRSKTPRSRAARCATLLAILLSVGGVLALPAMAQQAGTQNSETADSGSQSSSSTQGKQQKQPSGQKSAAQENPFPADVSEHAAEQQSQPADTPPASDADQQPAHKPGDASKDNPFPEDVSKSAAAAKDSGATGSSSSSTGSSSSSSSAGGDADANPDPNADLPRDTGRRKLKKPSEKDIQSGSLAGQGVADDDIRVGRFYLGSKDYKGAYGRFSEATRLDPTNVDAIYGMAAAAAGLHHNDEALTNYKLYLQIAPDGKDAKSARKGMEALLK
jgi:tetratricopeptide (TPR) repeat protein